MAGCCFRCSNNHCRKIYPIRTNSFFDKFPLYEVLNCFLNLEFNAEKAMHFIKEQKNINITKKTILNIYKKARNIIHRFLFIKYQTELLGELNQAGFFSCDESLFGHCHGNQIWILGIINNNTKEFRLEGSFNRDSVTLEKFIKKFVLTGNNIITDGWGGYDYLDLPNSGYRRIKHNHGRGDFGYGNQSTSHI